MISDIVRSNGKVIKHGGSLNDTFVNLILCVNLAGPRDGRIAGKTLFPGVGVRVLPEEVGIGFCG